MYYYLREAIVKTSIKNVTVMEFTWAKKKLYGSLTDVLKKIVLICPELTPSDVLKLSKEDVAKIMEARLEVNRQHPSKVPSGTGEKKGKLLTIDSCIDILSQRWGGAHPMIIAHNYSEQMVRDWLDDILLREKEKEKEEKEKDAPKGKIEDALNNKDLQKFKEEYMKKGK